MQINGWSICSYDNWHLRLSDVTPESVIVPIPSDVMAYLREDGIVLPQEAVVEGTRKTMTQTDDSDWDESDEDDHVTKRPSFPDFSRRLSDALDLLGGSVFVKLNWSAPVDASWIMADKTLRCTTLEDIYLLLKSSDKIARDLSRESQSEHGFFVVLKRWHDVHPGSEYRCFVIRNRLVAICQRDCTALYKHICLMKYDIVESITSFFKDNLDGNFPLPDYVFDVTKKDDNEMFLIDVSPFDISTELLLFTWKELKTMHDDAKLPEFRFLGEEPGYQPKHYGIPLDATAGSTSLHDTSLLEHVISGVEKQCLGASDCSDNEDT